MYLEKIIEQLSNEELKGCYFEIVEWRKAGTLPEDAKVRMLWEEFKEKCNQKSFPIHMMTEPILFEIPKRKYQPKFASPGDTIKIIGNCNAHEYEIGQLVKVIEWSEFGEADDAENGVEAYDGKNNWFVRHEDYEVIR